MAYILYPWLTVWEHVQFGLHQNASEVILTMASLRHEGYHSHVRGSGHLSCFLAVLVKEDLNRFSFFEGWKE